MQNMLMFNILLQKNCLVTKETDNSALHRGDKCGLVKEAKTCICHKI